MKCIPLMNCVLTGSLCVQIFEFLTPGCNHKVAVKDKHIMTPAFSSPVFQLSLYTRVDGAKVSHPVYNYVSLAFLYIIWPRTSLYSDSPLHYLPSLHLSGFPIVLRGGRPSVPSGKWGSSDHHGYSASCFVILLLKSWTATLSNEELYIYILLC